MRPDNRSPVLFPANQFPIDGMQLMVSTKNGMLTIEFDKPVSWLQFNIVDAKRFVHGLVAHIQAMEAN